MSVTLEDDEDFESWWWSLTQEEKSLHPEGFRRHAKIIGPISVRPIATERAAEAAADGWPTPIDLHALAVHEPQPPQHIIAEWLPAGEVTLLAGHGGAGKSAIALHLAACIALGIPWHGLHTERRRVLYLSHEDRADVMLWRLSRISRHVRAPIAELAEHLTILDASGATAELVTDTRDGAIITATHTWLAEQMHDHEVLIIDGASDSYGASEIVRRDVRRYIRAVRRLVPANGAALLLAHIDKAAARGTSSSDHYSGSTAWNNSVRARWALRTDDAGLVLALEKSNHAQAGAEIRLAWDAQAHMHLTRDTAVDGGMVRAIRERTERDTLLRILAAGEPVPAATTGRRTAYHVCSARPDFPDSLRAGDRDSMRRFWAHIEALRAMGYIREGSIRRSDRHYVAVLELTAEGRGQCGQ